MKLTIRVSYLKGLKLTTAMENALRYKSMDQFVDFDAHLFTSEDLEALYARAKASAEKGKDDKDAKGARGLMMKISAYKNVRDNPTGQKIGRLEALVTALRGYLSDTPNHWVFSDEKDGSSLPYYVSSIKYHEPSKFGPANVTMTVGAVASSWTKTSAVFHQPDLGKTVVEILNTEGFYRETKAAVETYLADVERYKAIVESTGEQFIATGTAHSIEENSWSRGRLVAMEREGVSSRVVMDEASDDGRARERGERKNLFASTEFWTGKKTSDDELNLEGNLEGDGSEGTVALPVHPYLKVFDLGRHEFALCHVGNLQPYVYDKTAHDKLILADDTKDLVSILVQDSADLMEDIVAGKTGGTIVITTGPPGTGKCLGRGTPVLMFDGWIKPVEEVCVGDVLMGPDSKPRNVLSTTNGNGALVRVMPLKGDSWICNDVHVLTLVHSETDVVIDVAIDDFKRLAKSRKEKLKLFAPECGVNFPGGAEEHELPVDPHFLGLWYGDGGKHPSANGKWPLRTVQVHKPDPEVLAECEEVAEAWGLGVTPNLSGDCPGYSITAGNVGGAPNSLLDALRVLFGEGLSLPQSYLTADRSVRLKFLAGFLDADGSLTCNCFEIAQKRKGWAEGICFLARSLGYRASMAPKPVDGEVYWRIHLSGDFSDLPMRIPRKKPSPRKQIKVATRTGFSIEPIGQGEYFGFTLDGDGRFLLGDFTVTHNTLTAEVASEQMQKPLYVVQCSQLGTNEQAVEQKLQTVLDRASRWGAILLIDEADVYVHERGDDIQQNAIVGVFLRVLEHYRGVLFLTSNRDTIIDDAIMSRATAWIRYELPDAYALARIWSVLADQFKLKLDEPVRRELVKEFPRLSGRNVKNLLKLGSKLAKHKNQALTLDVFKRAARFLALADGGEGSGSGSGSRTPQRAEEAGGRTRRGSGGVAFTEKGVG
jgi:hypothetical protein